MVRAVVSQYFPRTLFSTASTRVISLVRLKDVVSLTRDGDCLRLRNSRSAWLKRHARADTARKENSCPTVTLVPYTIQAFFPPEGSPHRSSPFSP